MAAAARRGRGTRRTRAGPPGRARRGDRDGLGPQGRHARGPRAGRVVAGGRGAGQTARRPAGPGALGPPGGPVTTPVTIVGGFLGSGKTTLLRRALLGPGTAVIVNEFGAVGIDHRLLYAAEEQTVLVGGGCACCAKRPDLARALAALLDADER